MSDENEDLIEKTFVEGLGAKYPMVKINAKDARGYGIKFYPSVYCIAADGTVHSVPDDRMPSEATIEQLLQDVLLVPALPDEARYAPVRQMWDKKQHDKLAAYFDKMLQQDKLDADMREVFTAQQAALQKCAEKQVGRVAQLAKGPDFLAAEASLERIQGDWQGFPAAEQSKQELDRFKQDATIKKEIAAGKAFAKLMGKYDPSKRSDLKKLVEALGKFAKKNDGTHAGAEAAKEEARLSGHNHGG